MATYTQRGIAAAEQDDPLLAYVFLTLAVEADPRDETAWLWLSSCVDNDEERQHCLERVLALNPTHPSALWGLELLAQKRAAASALARLGELN